MCGDVAKATKAALRDYGDEILVGSTPTRAAAIATILAFVSGFLPILLPWDLLHVIPTPPNKYLVSCTAPKQAATFNNTVVAFGNYVKCEPNNVQYEKLKVPSTAATEAIALLSYNNEIEMANTRGNLLMLPGAM